MSKLTPLFAQPALLLIVAVCVAAQSFPEAEISSPDIRAKLYLPDPAQGYYRGTRFDWSGVVASLLYKGHNYFGPWFERHDPLIHDAISGPVEEFRTNEAGLGYDEARAGETFIRIGVGVVRKPEEPRYRTFHTYEIVDHGKWSVKKGPSWIEFTHELSDASGYAYLYTKRLSLARNAPELTIAHRLKNLGKKTIETEQYNHNFFVIDQRPSGPGFLLRFPFELRATRDLKGLAEVRGRELVFLQELQTGQSVFTQLEGFSESPKDYDIAVENSTVGAGVRITGDRPLVRINFWSIRTTVCPEPYIKLRIEPGRETAWNLRYRFFTTR